MTEADLTESFVRQLTENQNRLYGHIYALIGDHSRAADVLQEANLVLWRKLNEFQPKRPFLPWAFAVARYQVLAHLRDRSRDRVLIDAELAESLAAEAEQQAAGMDDIQRALRPCLGLLTPANREMVERRYFDGLSMSEVAQSVERTVAAVKVALLRIRRQLADCVEKRLSAEVAP